MSQRLSSFGVSHDDAVKLSNEYAYDAGVGCNS